ncbi:MAG: histidine kinase [Cyclobacteriaceae bacterium]
MKKAFVHNIIFRIVWPAFYGAMIYPIILMVFDSIGQLTENYFNQEMWVCILLSYLFFEAVRLEIGMLEKIERLQQKVWAWVGVQLLSSLFLSIVLISGAISIYFIEFVGYSFGTFDTELITFNVIFGVTALLYNMTYFGMYFLNARNEVLLSRETTLRKNLELQIQAFNNDINPKFLYSCLETLITLLYKKGRESEKFVFHLSSIYRYILNNKHNELSPLEAELNSVEDLIYLFNCRHNERITFKNSVKKETSDSHLVTGTLSVLIEDIINNTIISEHQPLKITCEYDEDENYLILKSRINDKLMIDESTRKRSDRLQEAYSYFTSQPFFKVKAHEESFVKVPVIAV